MNGLRLRVVIRPEQRRDFPFPKSRSQLQIKHRQDTALFGGCQVGLIPLRRDHLQFRFRDLGRDTELCRIEGNQSFLHGTFQRRFQHDMDAMHSRAAEPRFFGFCILTNSAVFQQIFIELLNVQRRQLV